MTTLISTIAAAEAFLVISSSPAPTVIKPVVPEQAPASSTQKLSSIDPLIDALQSSAIATNSDSFCFNEVTRQTTESERIIGELRRWAFLYKDWDGEGASAPAPESIKNAVAFVGLIRDSADLPQPMLHATGNVSLYWDNKSLYADIEFLNDGRVAYFIKKINEDKHKGVLSFDPQKMPDVFSTLIDI